MPTCPLCHSESPAVFFTDEKSTRFFLCRVCDLRFVDPTKHLSIAEEKARYSTHENDAENPDYQNFVRPIVDVVRATQAKGAKGLDFGSGASSPIMTMLSPEYEMQEYDPHFRPDRSVLNQSYGFITACEVLEHVYQPAKELRLLRDVLNPGGVLAIMTLLVQPQTDFANWFYRRDPTHVVFYSEATFHWIAKAFAFQRVEIVTERLIVLS
jgi:hypothetical protein